ncbi:transposase [Ktedonobacter racemifer]|uniref:transposase n=1 Tax=Ktedonobacter racemifer TaxID=363277 RepID=UPI0009491895|nr:transposase [Ktedonobacter racemifer]
MQEQGTNQLEGRIEAFRGAPSRWGDDDTQFVALTAKKNGVLQPAPNRTREQAAYLDQLIQSDETIALVFKLAQDFGYLLRKHDGWIHLEQWKAAVQASGIAELITFVNGLDDDAKAVANGCSLTWSNGVVEGFVNKVKWIKRSSYGQAGFALLQRRVLLHPAAGNTLPKEQSRRSSQKSASAHEPGASGSRSTFVTFAEGRSA